MCRYMKIFTLKLLNETHRKKILYSMVCVYMIRYESCETFLALPFRWAVPLQHRKEEVLVVVFTMSSFEKV